MTETQNNWPAVSFIETDRYCTECGYNLRRQTVMRHPDLQILVSRCPECGRHHSASDSTTIGSMWARRLGRLGVAAWVLGLVLVILWMGFLETLLMYGTLDEMTKYNYNRNFTGMPNLILKDVTLEMYAFVAFLGFLSFVNGMLMGGGAVTFCYHWRRRRYYMLILVISLLAAAVINSLWALEAPHLIAFGFKTISVQTGLFILGGGIGIMWGRSISRLIIRAALPPRFWPILGDLWLIDKMELPQPKDQDPQSSQNV